MHFHCGGIGWRNLAGKSKRTSFAALDTATSASDSKPIRHYSTRDRENISDALSDLSSLLNGGVKAIAENGSTLLGHWGQSKDIEIAMSELDRVQMDASKASETLDGLLNTKYVFYSDVLKDVLRMPAETPLSKEITRATDFKNKLVTTHAAVKLGPAAKKEITDLMHPTDDIFADANAQLKAWVDESNERIKRLKADILIANK